ncbi:MAG: Tim44-like domain-containing protein [Myxococcota bacterium]|nr:Tim44-like domain-containing protein [Myxococcota bacterium]
MVTATHQRRVWLVIGIASLLMSLDAEARVGGGGGFGGGGGSSSSGSGSSDGLGILFELLIRFLWWLCWNYPAVGIPLTAGFIFAFYWYFLRGAQSNQRNRSNAAGMMRAQRSASTNALMDVDPRFSEPLFFDFAQLVYSQLRQGLPQQDVVQLKAHVDGALLITEQNKPQPKQIKNIIFGGLRIDHIKVGSKWHSIQLSFLTNFERVGANDLTDKRLRMEQWTFRRDASLMSLGPDKLRRLGCPACGSNLPVNDNGRCPNCDTVRTDGRLNWVVTNISLRSDTPLNPIDLTLGGGVEPGVHLPTKIHGYLGKGLREMRARHSDWTENHFRERVSTVFFALQEAWSNQKWDKARAYQTDALFQVHQFWIKQYQDDRLWNKNADIRIQRIEFAKVVTDSWLESITVRIVASMLDWTETDTGEVVSGSKSSERSFSEYWTFIRSVGAQSKANSLEDCPSCGAPLDKVNMSGICEYCDAHITTGHFDWVLSRIEQAEAYSG